MFPVLADRIDVAQVGEHAIVDGLSAGVGVNRLTERIFSCHGLGPFGPHGVDHGTCPYRLLPIGNFATHPKSQSGGRSAEAAGSAATRRKQSDSA